MTENTVNEIERMVVTKIFDAPRELVWKAWTDPKYIMQWWGPKGFTVRVCEMDFRVGGKLLCCTRTPDGQEFWNASEYHADCSLRKDRFLHVLLRPRRETRLTLRN